MPKHYSPKAVSSLTIHKLAAAVAPALCVSLFQARTSAQYTTTITTANVVTPSQATANAPFAPPVLADFQNYQTHAVEAPESIANPATDTSYLPNVVNSEDGQANSLAPYMAQAIAARAYFYYTQPTNPQFNPPPAGSPAVLTTQGYIVNSQRNQVYAQVGGAATATPNGATALEEQAVLLTTGIVLQYGSSNTTTTGDTSVDGFYVAGAVPTTANTPFGNATGNADPTGTQTNVTYNRGLTGSNVKGTSLGSSGNPANRGALSQNGINFLTSHADPTTGVVFNYNDALRYYYGADIHLAIVAPTSAATRIQHAVPVETFGTDNGYFGNGVTSSSNTGINSIVLTHSTDDHANASYLGSQVMQINANAAFVYRDLSGLGPNSVQLANGATSTAATSIVGTAAANLNMPAIGTISYWVKVIAGGVSGTTSIVLNNDTSGATQTSLPMSLNTDGQWHQYTLALADSTQFLNYNITSGFQSYFSVNSIIFTGTGATTYALSDLAYNETGSVPEPVAVASLLSVGALFSMKRRRRGGVAAVTA